MDICNNGHDEICYDSRICPLCNKIDDFTDQIESLNGDIKTLESKIDDLQNQLEDVMV